MHAKIMVCSVENPVLPKALSLKPTADQNTSLHASATARKSAVLISAFSVC